MRVSAPLTATLGGVLVLLAAAPIAAAQELRGTVLLADSTTPAVGVIIEAQDPVTGETVARTLSASRGAFSLRLAGPGTVVVRGLRIGQRPSEFGSFSFATGQVRVERFVLSGAAVVLDRVDIVDASVCGRMSADAHLVATLFDEARKAIRATQVTSSAGRMTASWVVANRLESLTGTAITEHSFNRFTAATEQPFVSLSPDSLAKVGYLSTADNAWIYQAPDANVLLSERFVTDHCFRAVRATGDAPGMIGIAFQPAPTWPRNIVGIEGTLWLDRASAELRLLEFKYHGVPRELAGTPAGGNVHFLRLPTGEWLVDRWLIQMPRPTTHVEAVFRSGWRRTGEQRTMRITSMEVATGAIEEVRRGSTMLYRSSAVVAERGGGRSAEAVAQLCASPGAPGSGVVFGTLRDSAGTAVTGASVLVAWEHSHRFIAGWQRDWQNASVESTTGSDGFWYACNVPSGVPLEVVGVRGTERGTPSRALLRGEQAGVEVSLVFGARRPALGNAVVRGLVFDSLRTGAPWSGVEVQLLGTPLRAVTDAGGRFVIDGAPRGTHDVAVVDRELALLRLPPPRATVPLGDGATTETVLATPSLNTYARALCGRELSAEEGVLIGDVRDANGSRRGGVVVSAGWTRMLLGAGIAERDPREVVDTTDTDGAFAVCGVPRSGSVDAQGASSVLASGEVALRASSPSLESGTVTVELGGTSVVRRDLVVGGARYARIGGRVLDVLGQPVPEATVVVVGSESRTARTDTAGAWVMDSVPIRSTELLVRALRFVPQRRAVDPVEGRMVGGEIRLERAAQMLEGRTITATASATRAAFEFRRASGVGTFLDENWIKQFPAITVVTVRSAIRKTRLVLDPSEGPFASRYKLAFETDIDAGGAVGGGGDPLGIMTTCFPRWYVDGVDFGRPTATEEGQLLNQAKRIEAYRAMEMPTRYTDFDGCGVILIWTYDLP